MFRRGKVVWSPIEEEFLKKNRDILSINQLTVALAKSRNAIARKLGEFDGKTITKTLNKRSVIGKRKDLGQFFRSNWEANVARWFNYNKKEWMYEPKVFIFEGVKHGTVSYCPDFKVGDHWIEVKGYLDPKGKTALRRFKKFHPEQFKKLRAIVGRPNTAADKFFKELNVPVMAYIYELNKEYKDTLEYWE